MNCFEPFLIDEPSTCETPIKICNNKVNISLINEIPEIKELILAECTNINVSPTSETTIYLHNPVLLEGTVEKQTQLRRLAIYVDKMTKLESAKFFTAISSLLNNSPHLTDLIICHRYKQLIIKKLQETYDNIRFVCDDPSGISAELTNF